MSRVLFFALLMPLVQGETIERIAIVVGQQVITELQIDEELRVTALLNHQSVARDNDARRRAADRLVQQLLVRREMELSHYPLPDAEDVNKYFEQIHADFRTDAQFEQALAAYHLSENTLRDHLALQLTTLRFIELRFRPDAGISDADIQNYYDQQVITWKASHPGAQPPAFASSRESIRKALVEARTDEALNTWLEESRKQLNIIYLDKSLE